MAGRGRFKERNAWPVEDATRWRRGLSAASLLDTGAHARKWRKATICSVERTWASLLHWLEGCGELREDEVPEQRLTPERLDAYCVYLGQTLAPTSIRTQLTGVCLALSVLAPGADVCFIRRRSACYPKHGDRLAKRARLPTNAALLQLGYDLMAEADGSAAPTRRQAVVYRDGLLIAVQAYRAMRISNLTSVELDRHLVRIEQRWTLKFPGAETKNHRLWVNDWPLLLVPNLTRYLSTYRPLLLAGRYAGPALWVSERPGALTGNGIYYAVITRTKAAFGVAVNPHLFRDAAATSIAIHNPANVGTTRHVLGHASPRTGQEYYNQARSIEASVSLNAALARRRRRCARNPR